MSPILWGGGLGLNINIFKTGHTSRAGNAMCLGSWAPTSFRPKVTQKVLLNLVIPERDKVDERARVYEPDKLLSLGVGYGPRKRLCTSQGYEPPDFIPNFLMKRKGLEG